MEFDSECEDGLVATITIAIQAWKIIMIRMTAVGFTRGRAEEEMVVAGTPWMYL